MWFISDVCSPVSVCQPCVRWNLTEYVTSCSLTMSVTDPLTQYHWYEKSHFPSCTFYSHTQHKVWTQQHTAQCWQEIHSILWAPQEEQQLNSSTHWIPWNVTHQTMTFIHSDREVDNHHTVRTHCTIQPCTLFISSKISPSPEISRLGTVSYIPLSEAGSIVLWYCHCVPIYRCKCMSRYCTHCSNSS